MIMCVALLQKKAQQKISNFYLTLGMKINNVYNTSVISDMSLTASIIIRDEVSVY